MCRSSGGQSLSPPYVAYYPAPLHTQPFQPAAASPDWSKLALAAAAVVGMGTSAYLLCRQYLPTVRIEYPPHVIQPATSQSQPPASSSSPQPLLQAASTVASDPGSQQLLAPPQAQPHSAVSSGMAPSGFPTSSSSMSSSFPFSGPPPLPSVPPLDGATGDRLGLRSLGSALGGADIRTEELLLRGVSDVRTELSNIAAQLKEQAQDSRRILTALQQTMDSMTRDSRDEQAALRALTLAGQQQQQRDSKEGQGQSRHGWETPVSPTSSRLAASSSSSPLSSSSRDRDRRQPSIDTAPVDGGSGSSWTLTNGRDSPRSAKSTSDAPPLPPLLAPSSPSAANSSLAAPPAAPLSPAANGSSHAAALHSRLQPVRTALEVLRSSNNAQSSLSALSSLSMYVSNVSPLHDKCRKVQLQNSNYQQRIARVQGAQDVLIACGFTMKGKALEWEPSEDKDTDNKVLAEAREAMSNMQAAITAAQQQQQQSSEHDSGTDPAISSVPLASPLPVSATNTALQSTSG